MNVRKYMDLAAQVSRLKDDDRTYFHGAVGLRKDGVLVAAANGNPKEPTPRHHCEYRLSRKLGRSGVVFLVRTLADGTWGDSTPCINCQKRLTHMEVEAVYYSIGVGVMHNKWEPWIRPIDTEDMERLRDIHRRHSAPAAQHRSPTIQNRSVRGSLSEIPFGSYAG